MADAQVRNLLGTADKRNGRANSSTSIGSTPHANLKDVASMKARLTAINATTYTPERLNTMTYNDLIYAIRLNDEPTSI